MSLDELIKWLEDNQDTGYAVGDGFCGARVGSRLVFMHQKVAKLSTMLLEAKSALRDMVRAKDYTTVYIENAEGKTELITSFTLKYWLLTGTIGNIIIATKEAEYFLNET